MGILRTNTLSGLETPTPVTGSVVFDGTGDYLTLASSGDFAFGTGDFTVEMWVYHTDLTGQQTYFGDTYGSTAGIYTYKTSNNEISLYDTAQRSLSAVNVISANTWYHIAWTRQSGILRAFLNGSLVDSDTYTGNFTTTQYYVGDTAGTSSGGMIGFISNLRVLKGTALYTANFTPPTRELQPIGDTVLLCCNNSTSATAEATGKTITANGNAVASTFSPGLVRDFTYGTQFSGVSRFDTQGYFVPPSGNTQNRYTLGLNEIVTSGLVLHLDAGNPFSYPATGVGTKWTDLSGNNNHGTLDNGVGYSASNRGYLTFDGSNQRVLQSSATINFSGGSMEVWAYFNNFNGNQGVFAMNSDPTYINLYIPTSKLMRWEVIGSTANAFSSISSTYVLETNTWYHIVGTFGEGSTTKLYINGVLNNTLNSYTNIPSNLTSSIIVGQFAGYLNGRISNAKIYNRALSAAEVSQNYEALKGRYGLP